MGISVGLLKIKKIGNNNKMSWKGDQCQFLLFLISISGSPTASTSVCAELESALEASWGEDSQWWLQSAAGVRSPGWLVTLTPQETALVTSGSVPHLPWPCWRTMPPSAQRCRLMQSDVWAKNLSVCSSCKFEDSLKTAKTDIYDMM